MIVSLNIIFAHMLIEFVQSHCLQGQPLRSHILIVNCHRCLNIIFAHILIVTFGLILL